MHCTCWSNNTLISTEWLFIWIAIVFPEHCKRWLEAEQAFYNFERMREFNKLEQFYEHIHPDLHSWLLEKNPKTLTDAAKLADKYNAVRKTHMKTQKTQFQWHIPKTRQINGNAPVSAALNKTYGSNTTDQPPTNTHETSTATSRNTDKHSRMICHYCQKKGHIR